MEEKFEIFGRLLEEERVFLDPGVDFAKICRGLAVGERAFNRFLLRTVGLSGSDILKVYRESNALCLLRNYGIEL